MYCARLPSKSCKSFNYARYTPIASSPALYTYEYIYIYLSISPAIWNPTTVTWPEATEGMENWTQSEQGSDTSLGNEKDAFPMGIQGDPGSYVEESATRMCSEQWATWFEILIQTCDYVFVHRICQRSRRCIFTIKRNLNIIHSEKKL